MSATNRGSDRDPDGPDFYPTPAWCVHRLLEAVPELLVASGQYTCHILEPCVGSGAIVDAVEGWVKQHDFDTHWETVDIRPDANADTTADFVWMGGPDIGDWYDLVLTNPPYNLALDFVKGSLRRARVVAMLLRLNWLASAERAEWMRENTPSVYVLPNRPSFTGEGTDATDYAWMVWGLGDPVVRVLATTPADVRARRAA